MKPLRTYDIQFVGLKLGTHIYNYNIKQAFFEYFEFHEYNDVNVNITVRLEKKTTLLELYFQIEGFVNVNCDLTNEPYNQSVESDFNLVVKFGSEYNDNHEMILIIPHGAYEINVAQYIYELIVLSVPLKRIHPGIEDGSLDSDIFKSLENLSPNSLKNINSNKDIDPRWNTLKKILTDKELKNGTS